MIKNVPNKLAHEKPFLCLIMPISGSLLSVFKNVSLPTRREKNEELRIRIKLSCLTMASL